MALILAGNGAIQTVAGTNAIQIDSSSRVAAPNTPYAEGYYSGSLARANLIPWSGLWYNVGNHWNTSSHRFTCPLTGVYQIHINVVRNAGYNAGSGDYLRIRKNGTDMHPSYYCSHAGASMYCASSDYIELVYDNDSAGIYLTQANFSIYFLG